MAGLQSWSHSVGPSSSQKEDVPKWSNLTTFAQISQYLLSGQVIVYCELSWPCQSPLLTSMLFWQANQGVRSNKTLSIYDRRLSHGKQKKVKKEVQGAHAAFFLWTTIKQMLLETAWQKILTLIQQRTQSSCITFHISLYLLGVHTTVVNWTHPNSYFLGKFSSSIELYRSWLNYLKTLHGTIWECLIKEKCWLAT